METAAKYLLLALALIALQISYTESCLNEKCKDKTRKRLSAPQPNDNICESTVKEAKVHCYCENTEIMKATRADCWVFNGDIDKNDPIWSTFDVQPFIERLAFNVRTDGGLKFVPLKLIHCLKRLRKLSIYYATLNKIEKQTFSNMTALTDITLMDSKIMELDFSAFTNLPSLVNLTVKDNIMTEIQRHVFVDLPSLRNLDLSFNGINTVHDGCFEHLSVLSNLVLEVNLISILTKDTFRGLGNLTRLDLRSNKLSMIGDLTFSELSKLNELLLDNNELKYLSERAFDGLMLLQKLSMTGNKLQTINEGLLEGVRELKLLDLRNNEIELFTLNTVKPILENLKIKMSVLYLSGNMLRCDCRLNWIRDLRNETKSEPLRLALDDVYCILNSEKPRSANDPNTNPTNTESSSDVFKQVVSDEDGYDFNPLYKYEATIEPEIEQVALFDVPPENLPCPGELIRKEEDSLSLSSKFETFWPPNSSFTILANISLVLTLALTSLFH